MPSDILPFRMAGNLYFVCTRAQSSHLIDTGDGLILMDVGDEANADFVLESIGALGFDVKNVKHILLTHGHYDHSHGTMKIKEKCGAPVYLFEPDVKYLNGFLPDVYLKDGDVIRQGNTEILCLFTPGHTEGTASYFFDLTEDGKTLRAGTFGGAGTNQLKKDYLDKYHLSYHLRMLFLQTIQRLKGLHVDLFIGNHAWQNSTPEGREALMAGESNPFIDDTRWGVFLGKLEARMKKIMREESRTKFVNYAHRGASEYYPENTLMSFCHGLSMGANGIETDVRRTKDGQLVLFHDKTLTRMTGQEGAISDYTLDELRQFDVTKNGHSDKILLFEDFLRIFSHRDVTFAIELKDAGIETDVADLLRAYHMERKTVVTSFQFDYIKNVKAYAPELRVGYLTPEVNEEILQRMLAIDCDEFCPAAGLIHPQDVDRWHEMGFRVRAYGITPETMEAVYDSGADGMTVNYPDRLKAYVDSKAE
ncbi:MAG: MBL fold metallo-hydrolase [Clostridia bacterium]|nr:MBL fold metallo-hydrolase [Clostridia bacterium]